jgi:hypothetical protein
VKYESNPKHREPWHHGRSGTLCPRWSWEQAQAILDASVLADNGQGRYGVLDGMAFEGREHRPDLWHGHPVAWNEVPPKIVGQWLREGRVTRREIKRLRDASDLDDLLLEEKAR